MIRDRNNQGWRIHYGWRGGGERFLVHKDDVQIASHLFTPAESRPAAPKVERKMPEAPASLTEPPVTYVEEEDDDMPPAPKRIDLDAVLSDSPGSTDNGFDLQKLPGVTARIAKRLGDISLEKIMEIGEEGLQEFDGIGPTRARSIYMAVAERLDA
jgi:hypothetical protein